MIKIERTTAPEYLLQDEGVKNENKDAIALFDPSVAETEALKEKQQKFKYKRYNSKEVKDALKKMCLNKCAYCESSFLHVYYGDIEHFRPKKFVGTKKEPIEPGYYWLANDWDNLLLSCLFCNQAKKHEVPGTGNDKPITLGKQNHFPLDDPQLYKKPRSHKSWKTGGRVKDEKARLLIDPCKDNPESFLEYTVEGVIMPRKVKKGSKKIDAPRGATSIEVYALQRIYLVQERKKRLIDLKVHIKATEDFLSKIDHPDFNQNPVVASYYTDKLRESIDQLFRFTHKSMPYSAMCRQFVYEFLKTKLNRTDAQIKMAEKKVHQVMDN